MTGNTQGLEVLERQPAADDGRPPLLFVKGRDRTCRHPGCGQPVAWVDHVDAYADGGPTDRQCEPLLPLPSAPPDDDPLAGVAVRPHRPGVLRATTPSGITRSTRPPGLRDRIEQRALPASPRPPTPPEEPPPF